MNGKIVITEKSITDLISHNGKGKRIHGVKINAKREVVITLVIFKTGTNNYDYVNTCKKFMLFFLEKGLKLGLTSILFKFMRDSIRESITGGSSKKNKSKFIPNGRLIYDILVENGLVDDLMVSGLTNELVKDAGKIFRGENLKSMGLISRFVRPYFILSKDDICGTRTPVDNYPIFTKIDPQEILMAYLESCQKDGIEPMMDPFNLPEMYLDVHGKRNKESRG